MEWGAMKGALRSEVADGAGRFAEREKRQGKFEILQNPQKNLLKQFYAPKSSE